MSDHWAEETERKVKRWSDEASGRVWVVAVSGGGDSVGLLRFLDQIAKPIDLSLSVAHFDHGVRGAAARSDAAFVTSLAASLGLPFDLGSWQPARPGHFESDARRARYAWLTEVARARGASAVATAHTRDDQAETILHRIVRGTGPRGLAGIPAKRLLATAPKLAVVRPFLDVSRLAIREYLADLRQPYCEDQTNNDLAQTRARIRHDLLPKLAAEYNRAVSAALVRLGKLAASRERLQDHELRRLERNLVITRSANCVVLKHGVLRSLSPAFRVEVLRRLWRRLGWPEASMSAERWQRLGALTGRDEFPFVQIGAHVDISSDRSFLVMGWSPVADQSAPSLYCPEAPIPLASPGLTAIPWAGCSIDTTIDPAGNATLDEMIDADRIAGPLSVRPPSPGDRFEPLGMSQKSMALADFFRGRRVPRSQRILTPLVCDQLGIVWVAGHRIADRVKSTEQTRQKLGLRLVPHQS